MKKAHNVYTEEPVWEAARELSVKNRDLLPVELTKKPTGSSSAYFALVAKAMLLIERPGLIHDSRVDWNPAVEYCKRYGLPLSKYISQLM